MGSTILDQLDTFGPERCEQLSPEEAVRYTRALTKSHYENFTVVSWLLPKRLREDFRNVYSFCRWADDLGDETGDPQRSLELLAWWRHEVDLCYQGRPRHPVFVALRLTIERHDIPRKPFDDLIDAFVQDQTVTRYDTWGQVLDYCTRSADPVGRLVLYLCGYRDAQRQRLSDATCTALQLANFWQDVRRDVLERDRVYLPRDVAGRHGLDIEAMVAAIRADENSGGRLAATRRGALPGHQKSTAGQATSGGHGTQLADLQPAYRATVRELVERTWPLFERGRGLLPLVASDVRADIKLFTQGGEAILRQIERGGYNTLSHRPVLSKGAKMGLMLRALAGKVLASSREPVDQP